MGRSDLRSISWLRHQMFPSTISSAQTRESDDLCHAMSPFSLFLSSFLGAQRILGYVRPRRIVVVHHPKTGRRRRNHHPAFKCSHKVFRGQESAGCAVGSDGKYDGRCSFRVSYLIVFIWHRDVRARRTWRPWHHPQETKLQWMFSPPSFCKVERFFWLEALGVSE